MACNFDDRECELFDFNILVQVHTHLKEIILIPKALCYITFDTHQVTKQKLGSVNVYLNLTICYLLTFLECVNDFVF
jgi:hypothetical protein